MSADKVFIPAPGIHFWRVKLTEKAGDLIVEGWIDHVPARNKEEAGMKAMTFYLRRHPDSQPKFVTIEREPYDRALVI